MKQMHSAAAGRPAVAVNNTKPVKESASKTDRSKKVKNIDKGMVNWHSGL